MDWKERLRQLAEKATDAGDQAAAFVARQKLGFVSESVAELHADSRFRRALALAEKGLDDESAPRVIELLLPVWKVDGALAGPINRLLGDAYFALDDDQAAWDHYAEALRLVQDPTERRAMSRVVIDLLGVSADAVEVDLLEKLGRLAYESGDLMVCVRHTKRAIELDRRAMVAYYYLGAAYREQGMPSRVVGEVFMRALDVGDKEVVLGWVEEMIPEELEWFERLAR